MKIGELTYPEVAAAIDAGAIALWPIGSTEAHGPHLPLATDVIIAEETCRLAVPVLAEATGLTPLLLPPLSFTITDFAAPFSGTVSVPKATTVAYVRDVIISVAKQGFRAVCLVNAHLEPQHRFALRDAVEAATQLAACPVGLADPADARFAATLTEEFASGSCHAGRYETSLVIAAGGRVLDEARGALPNHPLDLIARIKGGAKSFADAGADRAYCGDPSAATAGEGHSTYARLVEIVAEVVGALLEPEESQP